MITEQNGILIHLGTFVFHIFYFYWKVIHFYGKFAFSIFSQCWGWQNMNSLLKTFCIPNVLSNYNSNYNGRPSTKTTLHFPFWCFLIGCLQERSFLKWHLCDTEDTQIWRVWPGKPCVMRAKVEEHRPESINIYGQDKRYSMMQHNSHLPLEKPVIRQGHCGTVLPYLWR